MYKGLKVKFGGGEFYGYGCVCLFINVCIY